MTESDLSSLLPTRDWTRRDFVVTVLGSGFALAVQPVSAQTITTNAEGLTRWRGEIRCRDGQMPAYRAMPASGRPFQ